MRCDGYTKIWELESDELIALEGARGTTLRVTRGTLWITFEHDTRDVVLTAGDTFAIDRGGLTLVEARGRTTVCVLARDVAARRIGAVRATPWQRLRGWVARLADAGLARGWAPYA
jgi:hypothetical protein